MLAVWPGTQAARWSARRRSGSQGRRRAGLDTIPSILQICIYVKANIARGPKIGCYNSEALRRSRRHEIMKTFLGVVEVVLGILVMVGVLLQTPKASGLGGTIGGGGDSGGGYRTKRGLEKNLFYTTIGLVALFVAVSIVYTRVST